MSDIFDVQMAETYDDWYKTPKGRLVDKIEKEVIYEFLKPQPGMKILDIGCGTGNLSLELAKLGAKLQVSIFRKPCWLKRARRLPRKISA